EVDQVVGVGEPSPAAAIRSNDLDVQWLVEVRPSSTRPADQHSIGCPGLREPFGATGGQARDVGAVGVHHVEAAPVAITLEGDPGSIGSQSRRAVIARRRGQESTGAISDPEAVDIDSSVFGALLDDEEKLV